MSENLLEKLGKIGFSEYEAKAYVALLGKSPVSGYELAKLSGVPRSMIYETVGKLVARGAAMTLPKEGATKYAPVPAADFLDQLHREHEALTTTLKNDLTALSAAPIWSMSGTLKGMTISWLRLSK